MFKLQYEPEKVSNGVLNFDNKRKIGSLAGEKSLADGYNLDESNVEIAEMFGVDDLFYTLDSAKKI